MVIVTPTYYSHRPATFWGVHLTLSDKTCGSEAKVSHSRRSPQHSNLKSALMEGFVVVSEDTRGRQNEAYISTSQARLGLARC